MAKYLTKAWRIICRWWHMRKGYYVTLDVRDSSVSFSENLYKVFEPQIMCEAQENGNPNRGKVLTFFEPQCNCFGFVISPELDQPTQLADIQFNTKFGSVGFESLVPTVARMLHHYGINQEQVKLCVTKRNTKGMQWWCIERPI
jgi:hypothetical protein